MPASSLPARTDGAFLISGNRENGEVKRITVESPAGGLFSLANPWDDHPVAIRRKGQPAEIISGTILRIFTAPGEKFELVIG